MRGVTWVLRIASAAAFVVMAYFVYTAMDVNDVWHWSAPYNFIVTVFRVLSLLFFFLSFTVVTGLISSLTGGLPNELAVGLYNTLVLRMWYMQPYGVSGPITNVYQIFAQFGTDFATVTTSLIDNAFLFMYFLCAGISVALFIQGLFRMEHKFIGGAFVSMQGILIIAAFQGIIVPDFLPFPIDFVEFFMSRVQLLALASFAYIELSYQMIYSYSVGKPVEDREETLKKQLLALRQ
ncbi:MAG: hypothetical protein ACFE7R_09735, partial [Candidatus Hodarchaeota archaeon]